MAACYICRYSGGWRRSNIVRTTIPKNAKLVPANAERVFKGLIFDVYHWQQQVFDGTHETFEMLKRPDTVKVLAIKDNQIVIVEEEQPHHAAFIDLPGGRHDREEETELDAAKRELLEETGMEFDTWRLIEVSQPHTKIDWFVYVFLATNFNTQVNQSLDTGEKITVSLLGLDELKELVADPKARYLPKEVLSNASSIEDLLALPKYT